MQNADILVALKIFGFGIIRYHSRNELNKKFTSFFFKKEEWIYSLFFLGWRKEDCCFMPVISYKESRGQGQGHAYADSAMRRRNSGAR